MDESNPTAEEMAADLLKDPEYREIVRRTIKDTVSDMLNQKVRYPYIDIDTYRDRNIITVKWVLHVGIGTCHVRVVSIPIDLVPNPNEGLNQTCVASTPGNGEFTLELQEGDSSLILFRIASGDNFYAAHTIVSVPLSPEKREILHRALEAQNHEQVAAAQELDSFLEKQEMFDRKIADGIQRIKDKNLPPEDEEKQIEDFKDHAERLKEKFGI